MLNLKTFIKNDEGIAAIEYGLIGLLIIVVIVAAITAVGIALNNTYTQVQNAFPAS